MSADLSPAGVLAALAATPPLEALAVVLGFVYLALAIRQQPGCWIAAFFGTLLYLWIFAGAGLYMQSALQGYYVLMAVYGWWAWRRGAAGAPLRVQRIGARVQLAGLVVVLVASAATAEWLARGTESAQPFLDSLTTWGSVFTTWLVARKALENWAWWLVIDALIVVLCWRQGLYATAVLYAGYLVLVLVGWRVWARDLRAQRAAAP